MSDNNTIHAFKGMDKDMMCLGFQYEVGKTYETDKAEVCEIGFHACEVPLDVLRYYPPTDGNRYFVVEQSGEIDRCGGDSKVASTRLTVGAEIGIPGLVKAHVEWVKSNIKNEKTATNTGNRSAATNTGNYSAATNTGDYSAATNTGDRSAATNTGNCSAATNTGDRSAAEVSGKDSVAIASGLCGKARASIGSAIVLVERTGAYKIKAVKSVIIDGETYKPDVWYTLKDGEIVEVE